MRTATTREPGDLFGPRFTLFADVLVLGLVTAVASLPVLTAPAAMSTACAVLDRRLRADRPATAGGYAQAFRARLRAGDLLAGATAVAVGGLLAFNAEVAGAGLPGAPAFRVALLAVAALLAVVGLRACARPESVTDWPAAVRAATHQALRSPAGSALLLLGLATAALCGWAYPPLIALVAGPLALAAHATAAPGGRRGAGGRGVPGGGRGAGGRGVAGGAAGGRCVPGGG